MFLLRYRDPLRYAASLDQMVYSGHIETAAIAFARAHNRLLDEAHDIADEPAHEDAGKPPYRMVPIAVEDRRQTEQAIVESNAPIYGSGNRRWELQNRRREHNARNPEPQPPVFDLKVSFTDGPDPAGGDVP